MPKNSKKISFIIAGVFALYAALGFLLVPFLFKKNALQAIQDRLGASAQLEKVSFNPFTFELEISNLQIQSDNPEASASPRLQLGRLHLNLEIFPLFKKEIRLKELYLGHTNASFIIRENGTTNWEVKNSETTTESAKPEASDSSLWILTLQQIQIEDSNMRVTDRTHREHLELPLGPINLSASNISTSIGSKTSLEKLTVLFGANGKLQVGGSAGLKPLSANIKYEISALPADFMSSYLSDSSHLSVGSGTITSTGSIEYTQGRLQLTGHAQVDNFELLHATTKVSAVLWKTLILQNFKVQTAPLQVRLQELILKGLAGSIVLRKNGTLNYKDYLRPKPAATEAIEPLEPLDLVIEKFTLSNGNLNYTDQQIKPIFKAHISKLSGTISPVTTELNKKINVNLSGQVEAQGKFVSKGYFAATQRAPKLDLDVNFKNIEMTTFTPYAGKFAGYEISKGKMFLQLNYKLHNNLIKGKNNLILDQFTLGEKVENETSTSLPVKLALALLKDRQGKIKMELPVEGDVNSPKFLFSELIWTALKNVILNIVAAPFDVFKSMLGGGENPDSIVFEPGTATLAAAQQEKIRDLAKVLTERPNLAIEVQGAWMSADIEVLKKTTRKDEVNEGELKTLALQRGQLVQSALIAQQIEGERVFLLAAKMVEGTDKAPHTVLQLKSKD